MRQPWVNVRIGAGDFVVAEIKVTGDIKQRVFRLHYVCARRADNRLLSRIMGALGKDERAGDQSFLRGKSFFVPSPTADRKGNDESYNQPDPPHPHQGPLSHKPPTFLHTA